VFLTRVGTFGLALFRKEGGARSTRNAAVILRFFRVTGVFPSIAAPNFSIHFPLHFIFSLFFFQIVIVIYNKN
jgi:hypothetical protein